MDRGSLEIRYVVLFALAIIVLIVVVLIFYSGMKDFFNKITELSKEIWSIRPSLK